MSVSLSPYSMRLVADPRIDASGVRKSCEIDASRVLRTRSVSTDARAVTMSRMRLARSSAAAVCSASASSSVLDSESSGVPPFCAMPITPTWARGVRSGRNSHGTIGRVDVPAPAASSCENAQRAAVMLAVSRSSSGGHAACRLSSPSFSNRMAVARLRLILISVAAASAISSTETSPDSLRVNS